MTRPMNGAACLSILLTAAIAASCGESGARASAASSPDGASAAQAPAAASSAGADRAAGGPITAAEIRSHRLSMDRLRALHQAELDMERTGVADEEVEDTGDEDVNENATAADGANDLMKKFQERPAAVAALRRAGVTPREAAVQFMVLATARFVAAGMGEPYTSWVSPENVEFVRANDAELKRMEEKKTAAGAESQ